MSIEFPVALQSTYPSAVRSMKRLASQVLKCGSWDEAMSTVPMLQPGPTSRFLLTNSPIHQPGDVLLAAVLDGIFEVCTRDMNTCAQNQIKLIRTGLHMPWFRLATLSFGLWVVMTPDEGDVKSLSEELLRCYLDAWNEIEAVSSLISLTRFLDIYGWPVWRGRLISEVKCLGGGPELIETLKQATVGEAETLLRRFMDTV
ncbi:hypothetical protein [Humisphaera borealis]|uniref:Uncharacterized protein n=1 Tax=Humisphaera borealis TaxID=2807512 RepID=A0A7M2X2N7_9BACT|nr:hypothetical protein [Humisphaera borealis]QOV92018.1 hypothetical protein IPV69_11960 [Humisphaera borealis]